mgnify:CR=1 FL=1
MTSIYFTYPDAVTFSGQTEASLQILKMLKHEDEFNFHVNPFPAFAHKSKKNNVYKFILRFVRFFIYNIGVVTKRPDIIYLNIGQSYNKVLLHALPILLVRFVCKTKLVVSLHGNSFVNWPEKSTLTKLFKYILEKADLITYLGGNQKECLEKFKLNNLKKVNNCIDSSYVTEDFLITKQRFKKANILHLSLLIETKGFSIFLDSFKNKSVQKHKGEIEATLCGPIHFSTDDERFKTALDKEKWIDERIEKLKDSEINIKWVKGARGKLKDSILSNATIFVFPSTFSVEAQPLVLLEAAANGCAIITTKAGEIKNVFTNNEVLFINDATEESVADGIKYLIENPSIRESLAVNSYKKIIEEYSTKNYKNTWKSIFNNLT